MSDRRQRPSKKQADRQAKNKARYDALTKKLDHTLEHRSPGIWGWVDTRFHNLDILLSHSYKTLAYAVTAYESKVDNSVTEVW